MTGSFISRGTPKEWVGLGVFGLGLSPNFPLLLEGRASEKYIQSAYTFGKLSSCSTHMPRAWTPQTPAPQKKQGVLSLWLISCTDFHLSLPMGPRCDVLGFWDASYLSVGSRWTPLVWATHNWQIAMTLVADDVGKVQLSLEEKETMMPLNNFLCSTQSFY